MNDETLREKVIARQGAVAIREELQAQIDTLSTEIKGELLGRGVRRVVVEEWEPKIVESTRSTINPKKLLSAGVTVDQIAAGTETTAIVSLRVDRRKGTE